MGIELHQLRYFVAVAEERHFTKAARGLRVAQPSVSRALRVLEEELGTPLFHRMTGNVALTPAGEAFPVIRWKRGEPSPSSSTRKTRRCHVELQSPSKLVSAL